MVPRQPSVQEPPHKRTECPRKRCVTAILPACDRTKARFGCMGGVCVLASDVATLADQKLIGDYTIRPNPANPKPPSSRTVRTFTLRVRSGNGRLGHAPQTPRP